MGESEFECYLDRPLNLKINRARIKHGNFNFEYPLSTSAGYPTRSTQWSSSGRTFGEPDRTINPHGNGPEQPRHIHLSHSGRAVFVGKKSDCKEPRGTAVSKGYGLLARQGCKQEATLRTMVNHRPNPNLNTHPYPLNRPGED